MCRLLNVLLALLSRFLFAVHGVVTVWRVVAVKGEPLYWLLLTGVALLGVEMAVTLKCTRNAEWKWFSPMVFLYLSTVIPSIWFLELSLLQSKLPVNNSSGHELHLLDHIPITAGIVELDPENWVAGLEQTMLIVLVLGRWLMPKGDMSRDQLSQLLMVYVGLGADILDIFDTFKEPEVKTNRVVVITGLALFSWALMQFPLVLTQTRPSKGECPQRSIGRLLCCPEASPSFASCCSSEVWSLLLTVGLQDGPFLLYRIYLMVQEQVLNQLMIFFTCKNILIVLLELYRIFVVQCQRQVEGSGLERCIGLVLQCQTQRGSEGEEGKEVGKGECGGEQSCHTDMERGSEREEDQRGIQVKKGSKLREA
ncbi:transmembrane protein 26 [Embiotoca jacksoni]|uniref:transmembrane protein 26 n=1 Tax=Embiotoca jacksoni TaxID=100190 RepID=UPI00370423E5